MSVSVLPLPSHFRRFNRVLWSPLNGVSMAGAFVLRAEQICIWDSSLCNCSPSFGFLFTALIVRERVLLTL